MEMLMLDFERKKRAKRATAAAAQFPDLTVSSAEERRRRVFWQMPFRHNLYREDDVKNAGRAPITAAISVKNILMHVTSPGLNRVLEVVPGLRVI